MSLCRIINGSSQSCLDLRPEQRGISTHDLFEIHVTVAPLTDSKIKAFQAICREHRLKPIMIEFSNVSVQPMTCSRHSGNLQGAHSEANRLATLLEAYGFHVNRIKIEAAPTNSCVPQTDTDAQKASNTCYFEHHLKFRLEQTEPGFELTEVCSRFGAHLSRNAFKHFKDGIREQFVTLRAHGIGFEAAQGQALELTLAIEQLGYPVIASVSEYCVFDSNLELDDAWVAS
jgi:hypothetical protein